MSALATLRTAASLYGALDRGPSAFSNHPVARHSISYSWSQGHVRRQTFVLLNIDHSSNDRSEPTRVMKGHKREERAEGATLCGDKRT